MFLSVENDDELVFTFDNIHLAAAQDDEPGSKGHIDFTIDQIADLPVGTEIENTADIYFDFNEAIITNTTKNTIVLPFSINDILKDNVKIYPNPSSALINIELEKNNKLSKIVVYNVLGEIVFEANTINSNKALLNLEELSSGVYNLNISTTKGFVNKQIIISK